MLKTIKITLLTAVLSISFYSHAFIKAVDHDYDLIINGFLIANEVRSLKEMPNGSYRYTAKAETTGLVSAIKHYLIDVESDFVIGKDGLNSQKYTHKEQSGDETNKDIELIIDSTAQNVTGKDNQVWQTKSGPIVDDLSLFLALAYDLANQQQTNDFYYQVADGKKITQQHFKKMAELQPVSMHGEKVMAVRLDKQLDNKNRQVSVWLLPEKDYLPILIVQTEENGDVYEYQITDSR